MRIVTHLPVACGIMLALPACVPLQTLPAVGAGPSKVLHGDPRPVWGGRSILADNCRAIGVVAPLQVFSGGGGIWLRFAHIQSLPAMFGLAPDGAEQLLTFRVQPPYVYVSGHWPTLRFRVGRRTAQALRVTPRVRLASAKGGPLVQPIVLAPSRLHTAVSTAPVEPAPGATTSVAAAIP